MEIVDDEAMQDVERVDIITLIGIWITVAEKQSVKGHDGRESED